MGLDDLRECIQDHLQLRTAQAICAQLELAGEARLDAAHSSILHLPVEEVATSFCSLRYIIEPLGQKEHQIVVMRPIPHLDQIHLLHLAGKPAGILQLLGPAAHPFYHCWE